MRLDAPRCAYFRKYKNYLFRKQRASHIKSLWNEFIIRESEKRGGTPKTEIWIVNTRKIKFSTKNMKWSYGPCGHFALGGLFQTYLKSQVFHKTIFCQCKSFLLNVRATFQKSTNLAFYPTQNDATDTFYPMGPPKPIILFKMNWCYGKWVKNLLIIHNLFIISLFSIRWGSLEAYYLLIIC